MNGTKPRFEVGDRLVWHGDPICLVLGVEIIQVGRSKRFSYLVIWNDGYIGKSLLRSFNLQKLNP